jgi:hypothetical protein
MTSGVGAVLFGPVRGGNVETQQGQPVTHEARMEGYARRTAEAVESLRAFAWIWTIFAVLGALVYAKIQMG